MELTFTSLCSHAQSLRIVQKKKKMEPHGYTSEVVEGGGTIFIGNLPVKMVPPPFHHLPTVVSMGAHEKSVPQEILRY